MVDSESYIYHKEDIVTLKPVREATVLDRFVLKVLHVCDGQIVRVRSHYRPSWILRRLIPRMVVPVWKPSKKCIRVMWPCRSIDNSRNC